jgi:putative modified peptide
MYGEEIFIEIRISPRQAEELVDRLINDTEFRESLAQDPNAVLGQYGISIPAPLLPDLVELPSPDELRQAYEAVDADELINYGYQKPFKPFLPFFSLIQLAKLRRKS